MLLKKMVAYIFLSLIMHNALAAEKKLLHSINQVIHPDIPAITFNFYAEASLDNVLECNRITVIDPQSNKPIQVISNFKMTDPAQQFMFMDVNFDGIKDLVITDKQSLRKIYWTYNLSLRRFEHQAALDSIVNPEFDFIHKQIVSLIQDSMGSKKSYYQFQGDKPVMVRQEMTQCDYQNNCETTVFVPQIVAIKSQDENSSTLNKRSDSLRKNQDLQYLTSLANRKAACISSVQQALEIGKHPETMDAQRQLSECYKKIIVDVAQKFYPGSHFGNDLESEINSAIEHHHRILYKMAHCPSSKDQGCQYYEEYDVLAGTVDYLNELIEFMVLNIGEGYAEFNPEQWLKKWDEVLAKA